MIDIGAKYTDKELKDFEKEIIAIYKQASDDITKKLNDFNSKYKTKESKYLKQLSDGKITQKQFDAWKKGQVFQGKQWQAKKDQMIAAIANSNKIAANIMNEKMTGIFATNANFMSYTLEHGAGVNFGFGLYDSATVANLLKNNPKLLPEWKINEPKDYIWNQKKVNNAVTQGIIQGERLDQIAKRLTDGLCTTNKNKMLTFARTSMTGAQNAGRMYSLGEAKDLDINVEKEWMCTLDAHTRTNHRLLDGQKKPNDEPFEIGHYKIMYPGDPDAAPEMVYNCRCTMVGDVKSYPSTYDRYDNIDGKLIKNMTYDEWEDAKKNTGQTKQTFHNVVNGKNISNTWQRRPDKFDFEIEDVINAQGFDGLPRIVSADEFEKAVKAANNGKGFVAQRSYSAQDRETLDAYRDQLYHGKWYVDCSTGGAQYGQGMYCAADYNGEISTGIKMEMKHYKDLGESRYETYFDAGTARQRKFEMAEKEGNLIIANGGTNEEARKKYESILNMPDREWAEKYAPDLLPTKGVSYTETLTLDPSAKIISYDDIFQMKVSYPEKIRDQYKNAYLKEHASILGEDGIEFAKRNFGIDGYEFDWKRMNELYTNMSDEAKQIVNAVSQVSAPDEEVFKYNNMDLGAFAVLNGYDAINAAGHGASSSYTVILNRTKVIIKGE